LIQDKGFGNRLFDIIVTLLLALLGIACLLPLLNVLALSFSSKQAAVSGKVSFFPVDFTLDTYAYLLKEQRFFDAFFVSVRRVLLGGAINLVLTLLMAYPLSLESRVFPSRNRYMWFVVFTMLFAGGTVPWYFTINAVGIMDTIWALVLPGAVPVFNVILVMNYFRNLPRGIRESAEIDGVNALQMLIKIYIPISMPVIATVTLFSVVNHWNSFFDGMLLINTPEKIPLQTYIQALTIKAPSAMQSGNLTAAQVAERMAQRTFNAGKIVVSTIPILIIYPLLQRYFVSGITLGSVKE